MKIVVVLSGGMDSTVALAYLKNEGFDIVSCLSFEYGSKHNDREWKSAQLIANHYNVPITRCSLDFVAKHFASDLLKTGGDIPEGHYADPNMKKTVVPFRNGIMLSIASGFAESLECDGVALGNHFGDHAIYPDCRTDFIVPMAYAIENGTYRKIKLISPFASKTKTDIAKLGAELGVPFELTYSCYKGEEHHCGKCGTCFERIEAFKDAGLVDPTEYK